MCHPDRYRYRQGDLEITAIVCGKFKENTYILRDAPGGQQILIDPGDNVATIEQELINNEATLTAIILTHGHFDHIASADYLSQKYQLPVCVHKRDFRLVKHAAIYSLSFSGQLVRTPQDIHILADAEIIGVGRHTIELLNSPGHTGGGVCFYVGGLVFTGDTLLYQHIGPTLYPESNHSDLLSSVDNLLQRLPATTIIMPGHGRPWTIGEAKKWWVSNREKPSQLIIFEKSNYPKK